MKYSQDGQSKSTVAPKLWVEIEELYAAFRHEKLSKNGPDVCTRCCASPIAMQRLAGVAPEAVRFDDLTEFHNAAKGDGAVKDLIHLLPRTLEFVANGHDLRTAGLFSLFSVGGSSIWPEFSDRQKGAVNRYMKRLMVSRLETGTHVDWDFDPIEIIEMVVAAGFDVAPIFEAIENRLRCNSTIDFVIDLILNYASVWLDGKRFHNLSDKERDVIAGKFRDLIASPAVLLRLEEEALIDRNPEMASLAHQIAENLGSGRT